MIDVGELIDRRPMSQTQRWVVALCAAVLFVDGYDIQVMALAVPALAKQWQLPPSAFGLALSAVGIGLAAGSGLLGPLGDRIGRKSMLIITMAAAGITTCGTAVASTSDQFVLWRLLTGIALGAGIPSCAALTSEYAPVKRRSMVMGIMNITSPIGAFSAGFIAPSVLDAFGWRGTFLLGGIAPLIIAIIAVPAPESLKFMIARRRGDPRIAITLLRIAPDVNPAALHAGEAIPDRRRSVSELLASRFRSRTLLLWMLASLNLFNLYILISWLPTLLEQSGWNMSDALRGAVLIQAGGVVGGLFLARYLDRGATKMALLGGFALAAISLTAMSLSHGRALLLVLLLLIGAGVSGSQLSINALSAAYYPPDIKATGIAWTLVIGSAGSIVAPLVGSWLIELQLRPAGILMLLTIPPLICAIGTGFMRREWQAH